MFNMLTYALEPSYYSLRNTLFWGTCKEHFYQATKQQEFSKRIAHVAIAILELIPVIGQVISLVEKIEVEFKRRNLQLREALENSISIQEKGVSYTKENLAQYQELQVKTQALFEQSKNIASKEHFDKSQQLKNDIENKVKKLTARLEKEEKDLVELKKTISMQISNYR